MHVRALCRIMAGAGRLLHDFHFKTYRQSFGRETLRVVAGLVTQHAVHHVFSRHYRVQRMHGHRDGEISAVDVQLLVRRKWKTQILPRGIRNLSQDDVGGQVHLQIRRNQKLRLRRVGIDMKAGGHAEIQVHHGLLRALRRHQRHRSNRH